MMFFPVSVGVTGWSRVGWTVHSARAVRGGGGVVLADLLQLVPIFIPENGAPQLRASKMSPSMQLGAVVMCSQPNQERYK